MNVIFPERNENCKTVEDVAQNMQNQVYFSSRFE